MLGKLIDGRLVIAGSIVKDGNTTITNPTEEMLKNFGYKEIQYDTKPEYDDENNKLTEEYIENENNIVVTYVIDELTDEEHNAIIQAEIVAEENKITARNVRNAIMGDKFAKNKITEIENNIVELRAKIREIEQVEE